MWAERSSIPSRRFLTDSFSFFSFLALIGSRSLRDQAREIPDYFDQKPLGEALSVFFRDNRLGDFRIDGSKIFDQRFGSMYEVLRHIATVFKLCGNYGRIHLKRIVMSEEMLKNDISGDVPEISDDVINNLKPLCFQTIQDADIAEFMHYQCQKVLLLAKKKNASREVA